MRLVLVLPMAICPALSATAEVLTVRPESCERLATAQFDNCSVANIFRCQGDEAAFWIETIDADNMMIAEARNVDHSTLSVAYLGQGASMRLSQSKAHPLDTIRDGSGKDIIEGEFRLFGMSRPVYGHTDYGHAGESTQLAGETFARIAFTGSVALPPPMPETKGDGTLLYSEKLDLLVEERVHYEVGGTVDAYNLSHLSLSGQARFGEEIPRFGCGELSFLPDNKTEAET
jgi:hypothetical protein